jgi:GTP cyclohydrolase I
MDNKRKEIDYPTLQELHIADLIKFIGDDINRNGLIETPKRVIESWKELYSGYKQDPKDIFKVFDEDYDEIILSKDNDFFSTCEHHMLPFFGKAHIAYIPNGNKIIGASKLPRLIDCFARRLQIQERLTKQIAETIEENLNPLGVAVIIEATHLCMVVRGVQKLNSRLITSKLTGVFRDPDNIARLELMALIRHE